MTAAHLVDELGFAEEAGARRSIKMTRPKIARLFDAAGLPPIELIETLPPYGYRLVPELAQVRVATPPGKQRPRRQGRRPASG